MSLPRRGSRRDDVGVARPNPWFGPQPLAAIACAVTLIVLVSALRTWFVHRPPIEARIIAATAALAEVSTDLFDAVERSSGDARVGDVAAAADRLAITERQWRDEFLPAARTRQRADGEIAPLIDGLPEICRDAMSERRAWSSLTVEQRSSPGVPAEDAWNTLLSRIMGIENASVRAADITLEAVDAVPALRMAADRGESLTTAAALAGDRVLTDLRLGTIRSHIAEAERGADHRQRIAMRMLALALAVATAWYAVRRERRDRARRKAKARAARGVIEPHSEGGASLTIMLVGGILLASRLLVEPAVPHSISWGLLEIMLLQVASGLFVPWRDVRESVVPFVPLLVAWVIAFMLPEMAASNGAVGLGLFDRVVVAMLSPIALVPGAAAAGWRLRVRDDRAVAEELRGRVSFVDDELSRARIVHDAMFPDAFDDDIGFEYTYEPIHEIGGDYVHVHRCGDSGRVTVTLLDVAGHGLAAALTVNRLFGELERILAEDASATPGEIMELLNRYIHLTMARHSMFATGTCMTLEPGQGLLRWVSAGHPPSMLRRHNGEVSELETTTMLLGALGPGEFESIEEQMKLGPGDVVIAYTDGAFEARNPSGEQFGIARIRDLVGFDTPPRSWSRFIAGAVQEHHDGASDDDVLIATLTLRGLRIGRSG